MGAQGGGPRDCRSDWRSPRWLERRPHRHTTNPTPEGGGRDMHTRKCRTGGYTTYPTRGDGTRLIRANSERRRREEPAGGAAGGEASSGSDGGRVPGGRAGAG